MFVGCKKMLGHLSHQGSKHADESRPLHLFLAVTCVSSSRLLSICYLPLIEIFCSTYISIRDALEDVDVEIERAMARPAALQKARAAKKAPVAPGRAPVAPALTDAPGRAPEFNEPEFNKPESQFSNFDFGGESMLSLLGPSDLSPYLEPKSPVMAPITEFDLGFPGGQGQQLGYSRRPSPPSPTPVRTNHSRHGANDTARAYGRWR